MADTEDVWIEIRRHWSDDLPPSDETIANAENLLCRLKRLDLLPKDANRGYWPTVILTWVDRHIEIEVFESNYELNIYPPLGDGPLFDVHEFDSTVEPCVNQLIEKLIILLK